MLDEGNDGSVLSRRYGVEIEIAKAQLEGERAEFDNDGSAKAQLEGPGSDDLSDLESSTGL